MMKRPLVAILLACHLLVAALSVSPALHHWLHGDDADEPDHSCLVALAAAGMLDAPVLESIHAKAPERVFALLVGAEPAQPARVPSAGISDGRAPPVA
jgi:hypothetical protein